MTSLKRETTIEELRGSFDLVNWNTIYNNVKNNFLLMQIYVHTLLFLIEIVLMSKVKKLLMFRWKNPSVLLI